jgi:hypothetical protein
LFATFDITLEEYISRRLSLPEKGAFVVGQGEAGEAEDDWFHRKLV